MNNKITVESITIQHMIDTNPFTDDIGRYTDVVEDWVICCCCGEYLESCNEEHEIPQRGRLFRFFKPKASGEKEGSSDYQKYGKQDYKRMKDLNNGEYHYVGIKAAAQVSFPVPAFGLTYRGTETFKSSGLWGIESDAGEYLQIIGKEQIDELTEILKQFNIIVPENIKIETKEE